MARQDHPRRTHSESKGGAGVPSGRYSPAPCMGAKKERIEGNPDPKHISTSYAERANLSIRMGTRRFTRLTNAFSNKAENHAYAVAIYFMHYNFVRIHQTLRCTPAMAAGVTTNFGNWRIWWRSWKRGKQKQTKV